jgi:hypothetical protein
MTTDNGWNPEGCFDCSRLGGPCPGHLAQQEKPQRASPMPSAACPGHTFVQDTRACKVCNPPEAGRSSGPVADLGAFEAFDDPHTGERLYRPRTSPEELAPLAARIAKGRAKYPTGCTLLSLLDEAGEVAHAVNKRESHERVRDELLDVAAVAMRLYFGEIDTAWQPASPFTREAQSEKKT